MFGHLLGCYNMYTFLGILSPSGILPDAIFTLRPSLAFSYIGSVTARHSSSVRQRNFAACDKEGKWENFVPRLRHLLSLDIWVYLLFHRDLLNVHLCMLNVPSTPQLMVYLENC